MCLCVHGRSENSRENGDANLFLNPLRPQSKLSLFTLNLRTEVLVFRGGEVTQYSLVISSFWVHYFQDYLD